MFFVSSLRIFVLFMFFLVRRDVCDIYTSKVLLFEFEFWGYSHRGKKSHHGKKALICHPGYLDYLPT